jgi:hypothetical protein
MSATSCARRRLIRDVRPKNQVLSQMSFYTSVVFTPVDRGWTASPDWLSAFSASVGATTIDSISVYSADWLHPTEDDDPECTETASAQHLSVAEAVRLHRVDDRHWTHYLYPCLPMFSEICSLAGRSILIAISNGFSPWDCGVSVGYWSVSNYEDGAIIDWGRTAVKLSANGYPLSLPNYLAAFSALDSVGSFRKLLETLSEVPWELTIQMT